MSAAERAQRGRAERFVHQRERRQHVREALVVEAVQAGRGSLKLSVVRTAGAPE